MATWEEGIRINIYKTIDELVSGWESEQWTPAVRRHVYIRYMNVGNELIEDEIDPMVWPSQNDVAAAGIEEVDSLCRFFGRTRWQPLRIAGWRRPTIFFPVSTKDVNNKIILKF